LWQRLGEIMNWALTAEFHSESGRMSTTVSGRASALILLLMGRKSYEVIKNLWRAAVTL